MEFIATTVSSSMMNDMTIAQLPLALPEIVMLCMASLVLIVDLFLNDKTRGATYILSLFTLVALTMITLATFAQKDTVAFHGTFIRDGMGDVLKIFIYIAVFAVFVYSKAYLKARDIYKGEYYVLGLFAVLGMMIMVSAQSFLTIYLGLELLSLCLYAMVALQRDSIIASESAMKYFVLGAIASGMLLYGMSMIYGATGSLELSAISTAVAAKPQNIILIFGLVFIVVGVAFKLGAVPFHMWLPDVYQGSPTAVTIFIGSAPKIAAFAMTMRLLVDGLGSLHVQWQDMLMIMAIASMAIGNVVAIAQSNLKRMLAYSTISHVGFIMLGVLTGTKDGYAASMFYTITYTLMALGAFGMIMLMSRQGFEADKLDDLRGLNHRSPWFAFMMLIFMFSMAGVPPFVGFWAKLQVLEAVVSVDLVWLALLAVIFSIVGAFYYLRIIKLMYFDTPQETSGIEGGSDIRLLLSINGIAVLALGLYPQLIMGLITSVI